MPYLTRDAHIGCDVDGLKITRRAKAQATSFSMSDLPPSYDASQPARPTINFPVLSELHGKRVVLGIFPCKRYLTV